MKDTQIRLLLGSKSITQDRDFRRMTITVVTVENGKVRNPGTDSPFDDLVFTCQWDAAKPSERTYGWSVQYSDVYFVDLPEAERMVKMLKKISKLEFPVNPLSFGQYVVLIAERIGIAALVQERTHRGSNYSDNTYATLELRQGAWAIDDAIQCHRGFRCAECGEEFTAEQISNGVHGQHVADHRIKRSA